MTSFFTANDMAGFKQMSDEAMDCLATIQSPVNTRGAGAVTITTYVNTEVNVPCRLSQASMNEQVLEAEQLRNLAKWLVVLPVGTTIPDGSQLIVTGKDGAGVPFTLTLRVVGRSPVRSNQADVRVHAQFID